MNPEALARDMAFLDRELIAVVERHFQVRLAHDLESVARLDRLFADGPLRQFAVDDFQSASVMLAAYLGETVIALARGGRWELDDRLGPCIVEVPGSSASWRVLTRAERRIRSSEAEVLLPFIARAAAS